MYTYVSDVKLTELFFLFWTAGVDRPHPRDIAGPANEAGREAAGLRFGDGRAAAQL